MSMTKAKSIQILNILSLYIHITYIQQIIKSQLFQLICWLGLCVSYKHTKLAELEHCA